MDKITKEAYFRQRVVGYAEQHGVSVAANRYHLSRKHGTDLLLAYEKAR